LTGGSERALFDLLLPGWFALALAAFIYLTIKRAPYGRHGEPGWGPLLPARLAWVVMELPAVVTPLVCALAGSGDAASWALLGMWELHYLQRAFVFPMLMRPGSRPMPAVVALTGALTNIGIGWLVWRWLFSFGPRLGTEWLGDPRFVVGALVFGLGMALNLHSDALLRGLRGPGETGYKIPRGGAFRWVTCPNYSGEIIEWVGFALASWCLPAFAFVVWTLSNLVPRARLHHAWYREKFADYPAERRALVPRVW